MRAILPHGRGVWCGLVFQQPCNLLLVKENSGCSDLALFYVCKAKVCICAVLDSAKVGIVWVALCFTPFSFTIAALKMRQLEQSRVLYVWAPQTFYAVEEQCPLTCCGTLYLYFAELFAFHCRFQSLC